MKKGIVVAAAVVAVSAGGMWFIKSAYQDAINTQLAMLKNVYGESGVNIDYEPVSSSFFSVTDRFNVTITRAFLPQQIADASFEPAKLVLNNECGVFPFYMACNIKLDTSALNLPERDTKKWPEIDYDLSWSVNAITRSLHSDFSIAPFEINSDGAVLTFRAAELNSESDLSLTETEAEFSWDGMTLTATDNTTVTIDKVSYEAELTRLSGTIFVGEQAIELSSINVNSPVSGTINADNITIETETKEEDDSFTIEYDINTKRFEMVGGMMPMLLTDFEFESRLFGINKQALTLFSSFQTRTEIDNIDDLAPIIDALGKNEPGFEVETFDFKMNDVPFDTEGEVNFDTFTFDDVQQDRMIDKVTANAEIKLGKDLDTKLPQLVPVLQSYVQNGIIEKQENGDYTTKLELKDRVLSANGNRLKQF